MCIFREAYGKNGLDPTKDLKEEMRKSVILKVQGAESQGNTALSDRRKNKIYGDQGYCEHF